MSDFGGCLLGCAWFVAWLGFQLWWWSWSFRSLGGFAAVAVGLGVVAAPFLVAAARSSPNPKSPHDPRAP